MNRGPTTQTLQRIIMWGKKKPCFTRTQAVRELNINGTTVNDAFAALEKMGVIVQTQNSTPKRRYYAVI